VEISISSPIPGLPDGKPAGQRCIQLTDAGLCQLFGHSSRPAICVSLKPSAEMCGDDAPHAYHYLAELEVATKPEIV
jgi:hypothetical protein